MKMSSLTINKFCTSLVSTLVSVLFTPLILVLFTVLWLMRFCVKIYLRLTTCGKVELMAPMDAFQVYDKPNNRLESYTIMVIEGKPDINRIRKTLKKKILSEKPHLYRKLTASITKKLGYYCWNQVTDMDMDRRVRFLLPTTLSSAYVQHNENARENDHLLNNLQLDAVTVDVETHREDFQSAPNSKLGLHSSPETYCWTEKEVMREIGNMYQSPLPLSRPRWEFIVIPNFQYDQNHENASKSQYYGLILRVHHSIMDGFSIFFFLSDTLCDVPVQCVIDPLKSSVSTCSLLLNYLNLYISWPKLMYDNIQASKRPEQNCFHGPELSATKFATWSRKIRIEDLRKIRNHFQTTSVAILNAAAAGAFQRLAHTKGLQAPKEFTFVFATPLLPYPDTSPQNRFSGAFFTIEVDVETTQRIKSTANRIQDIMESPLFLMNCNILNLFGMLPARFVGLTDARELTCLASNIPGPVHGVSWAGDKLVDIAGFVPIKNKTGFGMSFVGNNGDIRCSVVADSCVALEGDVELFCSAFEEEFQHMIQLCESSYKKPHSGVLLM